MRRHTGATLILLILPPRQTFIISRRNLLFTAITDCRNSELND
jgi:hypothetical protein